MILIGAGTRSRVSREIFILSLSLFSVIIQLFGVITALGRVIGDVGGKGEGLDRARIDPTRVS